MIDGTVVRKTGTDSQFGVKLDSVADFVFVAVCLVKILPAITIPRWIWIWIGIIAVIKLINVVSGFAMQKTLVVEHTLMNKITGALLFVLPLTLSLIDVKYSGSNHCRAPQVTVCPLSTKLKDIKVHVKINPLDVNGLHLQKISDFMPEDMQTVSKSAIRGHIGYITVASNVMEEIDKSLITQLSLWETAKKLVREELLHGESKEEKIC